MKKLKVLIASMVGAIALVFACVVGTSVHADGEPSFPYLASNDTRTGDITANTIIASDSNLEMVNTDGKSKVVTTSGLLLGDYSAGVSAQSNGHGFTFIVKNDITLTIKFGVVDSSNKYAGTYNFGAISSGDVSDSSVNTITENISGKDSNVTVKLTGKDSKGSNRRIIVYEVTYTSYVSTTYTATFSFNGGSGTAIPNVVKNKSDSVADRTISLPTTDAAKTAFKFVGWSNGDSNDSNNPYKAGDNYVLTKDVQFSAVWDLNVEYLPSNYSYTFESLDSNSYIAIEGGLMHENGIKTTADLTISFELACANTITLTFDNYNLGSKNKIKIDNTSYAVSTTELAVELSAGVHKIERDNKEFRLVSISSAPMITDSVTATLYKQFDKNTNPTMLRLMGKIEGIAYADYENISNVLMEFDFNNGTSTTSKSAYCYKLYKSIKTLDGSLDADEDGKTMYVVLTISGLEKYSSMSFTNVKMTITFSDGSTKEATHTNF